MSLYAISNLKTDLNNAYKTNKIRLQKYFYENKFIFI